MAGNIKQHADGSAGLYGEAQAKSLLMWGGGPPVAGGSVVAYHQNSFVKVAFGALAGTAGLFSVVSPFPEDVIIGRAIVNVTTGFGTTTANLSIGTGSTSSSDYGNNLLDTLTSNGAGVYDNITDKGTNGKSRQKWAAGTWVTGTCSITPNTLVGSVFLEVIRP